MPTDNCVTGTLFFLHMSRPFVKTFMMVVGEFVARPANVIQIAVVLSMIAFGVFCDGLGWYQYNRKD